MRLLLSLLLVMLVAPMVRAADLLEIQIPNGEVKSFSRENLESLPQVEIRRKSGDNPERIYSGPALDVLLAKCGIAIGEKMKGDELHFVVLAKGADGYAVTLSLPELEPSIAEGKVIVALSRDHTPLSPNEGPLRLIVEKDQRPVRWVKNLVKLTVSDVASGK